MYNKPEVRIVQDQQIQTSQVQHTNSEVADLLAKYGYSTQHINREISNFNQKSELTVEEIYAQQYREFEMQRQKEMERRNSPKAVTFDSRNINYSQTDYRSLEDGFGVQVQVVSDMPIYNNNRRY